MNKDAKRAVTPKLRFPEFREGNGWVETTLGLEAAFHKGRGVSKAEIDLKGKRSCIRYGELYTRYGEVIEYVYSRTSAPDSNLFLSLKNDVIIPASGETKEDIAKASCVLVNDVALGGDLNVVRTSHNGVFLSYFLNGAKRHDIAKVAQGDTVAHLYPSQLKQLSIAFPTDSEQQKIADCLTSLDEVIAAQGRKVEALKAHKKGLMQQLFPREGETLPRLRFPEFRDGPEWDVVPLGGLLAGKPEYGVNAAAVPFSEKLPAYLRITDIDEDGRFITAGKASVDIDALEDNFMSKGDIALARTGASVGKSYRYRKEDGPLVFAGFLIRIRPNKKKIVPRLLANFLTTQQYWDWVRVTSARSGQPGINGTEYATLQVPVPPPSADGDELAEQQRIADCLSSLDAKIASESEKLAALKTHKKGLMQQLFPAAGASHDLSAENVGAHQVAVSVPTTSEVVQPAAVPSRKPYTIGFARQLLAAEILQHCHKEPTMGRVKLQKLIHLCEYHAELDDIHGNYARAAAGPFDNKLMRGVAKGLEKQKWFKEVRGDKRTSYEPMESSGKHSKYLGPWREKLPKIHEIIRRFATAKTYKCEIVSTLYAAWNDLLINGGHPTDEEIVREASDAKRWHESKANIDKSKWPTALKWMREKGLVPRGYGAHTTR